jgi:hypothetical protein
MKSIILLIAFSFFTTLSHGQSWVPATPFPGATGGISNCVNNNQTFINSSCIFENELYVGGNFTSIGGIVAHGIARWNGSVWNSVGLGNLIQNDCVKDIIVYNSNLYFTADKLYKWDGTSIQEFTYLNSAQNLVTVYGRDLHVFNGELYISSGSSELLKYNGSSFTQVDLNSSSVTVGSLRCVDDYNNTLYIGTTKGLFKNQNGNWIDCNGITTSTPEVYDIETYNNELYVLGYFSSIGGLTVNNLAKYNGSVWTNISLPQGNYPVTYPLSGYTIGTNHLKTMNNELYIAHTFTSNQQTFFPSPLTKYNGNQWIQIADNHNSGGGCSIFYNNELYCGGRFFGVFSNVQVIEHFAKLQNNSGLSESHYSNFQLNPNPTSNSVTINSEKMKNESFIIYDQLGRTVITGKLNGVSSEVNLSALSKGIYTLKIEGNYQPTQIVKE